LSGDCFLCWSRWSWARKARFPPRLRPFSGRTVPGDGGRLLHRSWIGPYPFSGRPFRTLGWRF
jgi:hypothetical protein